MSEQQSTPVKTIAIIGGTGKEGKGLAYRWAKAGIDILIGSRSREKAEGAAAEVNQLLDGAGRVRGLPNEEAAELGDLLVITVPYAAHAAMCEAIKLYAKGKIVIDVTVPLVPPKVTRVQMPPAGSATQEAQLIMGEDAEVVAAFQNISYEQLLKDEPVSCDVLVCGRLKSARATVLELVRAAGLVGYDAGPIENAVVVEGLTSVLIGINKQFGVHDSGIRITSVPQE
ncbi:MAG TPA: NADPH-dependent F420 reductase [Anaerolineaceae bacterium]|nr:NADPH-dependent F420 reductase [Anaerolineaceae bacterium]